MLYTITYSDTFQGWPSFYSYYPDWMLGMNNYFYTWKGGDLYQHNDSAQARNTFYYDYWLKSGQPNKAFTPSSIESVFNPSALENLLFKTIDIQGDSPWDIQLATDLQNSGFIDSAWFEKKESTYFAFIRNNSSGELSLRSMNGIGQSIFVGGIPINEINFSISPLVQIDSIVSVDDILYWVWVNPANPPIQPPLPQPPYVLGQPYLAGQITNVTRDYKGGINRIKINTAYPGSEPITTQDFYFFYVKNSIAESHGVLGHYCTFTMQNDSQSKVELFAVESDVMKSYP